MYSGVSTVNKSHTSAADDAIDAATIVVAKSHILSSIDN